MDEAVSMGNMWTRSTKRLTDISPDTVIRCSYKCDINHAEFWQTEEMTVKEFTERILNSFTVMEKEENGVIRLGVSASY